MDISFIDCLEDSVYIVSVAYGHIDVGDGCWWQVLDIGTEFERQST